MAAAEGDAEKGARLVGAADTIQAALGYQFWSSEARMFEKVEELIAERGDPAEMEAARRDGSRMSYEAALALAVPT